MGRAGSAGGFEAFGHMGGCACVGGVGGCWSRPGTQWGWSSACRGAGQQREPQAPSLLDQSPRRPSCAGQGPGGERRAGGGGSASSGHAPSGLLGTYNLKCYACATTNDFNCPDLIECHHTTRRCLTVSIRERLSGLPSGGRAPRGRGRVCNTAGPARLLRLAPAPGGSLRPGSEAGGRLSGRTGQSLGLQTPQGRRLEQPAQCSEACGARQLTGQTPPGPAGEWRWHGGCGGGPGGCGGGP
ncbi:hypothetical protein J0S82_019177 [Galemys pyrenaicus]|uniref:Uncharacterized protein n=1 Tax=Galemys pyrenaicus TaxID=202257 RepID=A0A8J6ABM1_GALPY|nr:hypothetical protein J0S82_019177 [Galemys pyrenaicus]